MDADYDIYEIVKIIPDFRLFDSEFYQRNYCTNQGKPLDPGYYVVSWPEAVRVRRFNEQAAYHGPYKFRKEAQTLLDAMHKHKYMLIVANKKWGSVDQNPNVIPMETKKVA